jgi:pantetheine-phosphate adenylyltransferase
MDLIGRAAGMFDSVTVAVMVNISKNGMIPYEERVRILRKACAKFPNVQVELWKGLLADYLREHPSTVVVRSVRNAGEAELEIRTAAINRRLFPGAETLLIPASADLADISSSAVREIAGFGGDIREFVPKSVYREIMKYMAPERSK